MTDAQRDQRLTHLAATSSAAFLMLRMTGWALLLPVLKHTLSIERLARLMWRDGLGPSNRHEQLRVARLSWRTARLRPLPGRDNCLERSLIAYRYLSSGGADPRLVVAVRRLDGAVDGHVWVTTGGQPILDEDVSAFTPLFELGPRGERLEAAS